MNSRHAPTVRPRMPAFRTLPPMVRSRMARQPVARAARGFTLIEIVVAFSILAVGLGVAMQIATGAMRQSRSAADYTEAALYAQSLLDTAGVGERLEEGSSSGEFDDRFSWELRADPFEIQTDSPLDPGIAPVELVRLELLVRWQRGRGQREVEPETAPVHRGMFEHERGGADRLTARREALKHTATDNQQGGSDANRGVRRSCGDEQGAHRHQHNRHGERRLASGEVSI